MMFSRTMNRLAMMFLALLLAVSTAAASPADRGGIVYGMKLEGVTDKAALVARYVDGLTVAVISEANIAAFPDIVPTIRRLTPDCRIALEVSAWGAWTKPSSYYPLRTELGVQAEANGWWMKRVDGSRIVTHPNFALVDFTIPAARAWYAGKLRELVAIHRVDLLFYDEVHRTLGFLPRPETIVLSARPAGTGDWNVWMYSMRGLVRGGGPGILNGTQRTRDGSLNAVGRYRQNATDDLAATIADAQEFREWCDSDLLIFEQPSATFSPATQVILNGLVATFGGSCQQNVGGAFREPIPGARLMPEAE